MNDSSASPALSRPPRWVIQSILVALIGYGLLGYVLSMISSLRSLFIILLVSLFLSFAIEPAVNRMENLRVRRGVATGIMFLLILGAIGGFGVAVGALLAEQLTEFSDNIPTYLADIDTFLEDQFGVEEATADLRTNYEDGAIASYLGSFADDLARFGSTVVNVLFQLFTIGLFTFYLVAEGPKLRRSVCSLLSAQKARRVLVVWDLAIAKTGGYILSRAALAIIAGVVHWVAFEFINLPSALALALWVGVVSQFIPVIGTYIAGVLPVVVGLLDEPSTGLWALVIIVVYQQLENYFFAPRITAHTMEIHPAVAFGSVIAGNALLGVVGALLALPFAATLQAVISATAERYEVDEETLKESRARRGRKERPRRGAFATTVRGVLEWVGVIAGAFVFALVVKTFLFQAYYIPSPSMEATLEISDRIIVNKLSYQLHDVNRGDVIVFKNPEGASRGVEDLIKRVVGLPGETVQVQGGRVYIDKILLLEPYLAAQDITGSFRKPPGCVGINDAPDQCTVADGYVFVMGDNRPNSNDSRVFGPIPVDSIEGRAFLRVWPLGRFGRL
ncbi:MAG TPA: signal peptidase I [Acidimicrobiia bacterium]|nr:signal peptidase I [Acidimicrobiia bacterium]